MTPEYNFTQADSIIRSAIIYQKKVSRADFEDIFRYAQLPENFYYLRWMENGKKFIPLFLSMPQEHQKLIAERISQEPPITVADYVHLFFHFACNWNSTGNFWDIVFEEEGKFYEQVAREGKSPFYISPENIFKFYFSLVEVQRKKVSNFIFQKFEPNHFENRERERRRAAFINEKFSSGTENFSIPEYLLPLSN